MSSILLNKSIPLEYVFNELTFLLLGVSPTFEYVKGEKTENIIGYTYLCVELNDFERLRVKIKSQKKPIIAPEELLQRREAGEKIYVKFDTPTVMPYFNGKSVEDSFLADNVSIIETVK